MICVSADAFGRLEVAQKVAEVVCSVLLARSMVALEVFTRIVEVLQIVPSVIVPVLAGDAVELDGVT